MRTLLCTLSLLLLAAAVLADEPILGTFENDAVLLVRDGAHTAGREEWAVQHGGFRYLFRSEETRDAFVADPAAYEIQLGGGCGRMGALSGTGRTDIFTVHEGRLYIFASQACHDTFVRDPSAVLELLVDPEAPFSETDVLRGRELLAEVVAWMGGAERVDAAVLHMTRERTTVTDGKQDVSSTELVVAPGGRIRESSTWNDQTWSKVLTPDDAFFVNPVTGVRSMVPSQRTALERRRLRELLALMQARHDEDFVAAAKGEAVSDGTTNLHLRARGMNHVLRVWSGSGEVAGHAFRAWGPGGRVGAVERSFTRWGREQGVLVPKAWDLRFDGEDAERADLLVEGYTVEVLTEVPEGRFERP